MLGQDGVASDSLRRVLDRVFEDAAFHWVERPNPLAFLERWWSWATSWLTQVRETQPQLFEVIVWVLVLALLAIVLHAALVVWRTVRGGVGAPDAGPVAAALPRRESRALWLAAERAATAGQFRGALGLAFDALVLEFDDRGVVRYHPAKTPAEYAREARLSGADTARLHRLVMALYRVDFAGEPCDGPTYVNWRDEARQQWHAAAH